jgi:hypothetical protein
VNQRPSAFISSAHAGLDVGEDGQERIGRGRRRAKPSNSVTVKRWFTN